MEYTGAAPNRPPRNPQKALQISSQSPRGSAGKIVKRKPAPRVGRFFPLFESTLPETGGGQIEINKCIAFSFPKMRISGSRPSHVYEVSGPKSRGSVRFPGKNILPLRTPGSRGFGLPGLRTGRKRRPWPGLGTAIRRCSSVRIENCFC